MFKDHPDMKAGICIAGTTVVDRLITIEKYPLEGHSASIKGDVLKTPGGLLSNVAIDLAKLDPELSIYVIGKIGNDQDGVFLLDEFSKYPNINTQGLIKSGNTSFTNVMISQDTKQRTFFTYEGLNDQLKISNFNLEKISTKIFHLGYLMCLGSLDAPDEKFGTKSARLLSNLQKQGVETSIDITSDTSNRYKTVIPPALKYTDYCTLNEIEASAITGVELNSIDEAQLSKNMHSALDILMQMGVSKWAIIHTANGSYGMNNKGQVDFVPSLKLPINQIVDTVGAGDAFCAGVILGAYYGKTITESMYQGHCVAASSLKAIGASEGVKLLEDLI